jgi:hypothetical protein
MFMVGFLAAASPGCSWIGMTTVPDDLLPGQKLECSGWTWPILDTVFTVGFSVAAYEVSDFGIGFLTAIPVIIALLYAASGGTGFYWANECHQARKSRVELKPASAAVPDPLVAGRAKPTKSKLPVWARPETLPAPGPRRELKKVPSEYRHYCRYEAGTLVHLETKTQAAEVKFLKCTSIGVEVQRQDKAVGVIAYSRIWGISKAAPAEKKLPAEPASIPRPAPPPKVEPPPVPETVEVEVETGQVTSGAFVMNNVKVFWGMGVALGASDPYSARRRSDRRARTEIFNLLKNNLHVFAGMAPEDVQMRLAALEKAAVKKTTIVDRWLNTEEDSCTSIAVLPVAECGLNPVEANILWNHISRSHPESR